MYAMYIECKGNAYEDSGTRILETTHPSQLMQPNSLDRPPRMISSYVGDGIKRILLGVECNQFGQLLRTPRVPNC